MAGRILIIIAVTLWVVFTPVPMVDMICSPMSYISVGTTFCKWLVGFVSQICLVAILQMCRILIKDDWEDFNNWIINGKKNKKK